MAVSRVAVSMAMVSCGGTTELSLILAEVSAAFTESASVTAVESKLCAVSLKTVSAATVSVATVSAGMLSIISEHLQRSSTLAQAGESLLPMQDPQNSMQVSLAKTLIDKNKRYGRILFFIIVKLR